MMTTNDINRIKKQITTILNVYTGISPTNAGGLLPMKSLQGKLYEAYVLATICEGLVTQEQLRITFVGGNVLTLRQKGGPIDKMTYPYFQVWKQTTLFGELFTDIYFTTLSYKIRKASTPQYGDYHELDIALLQPNQTGYPQQTEIILAVECKNTSIKKSIIREVLGFRRELSMYPANFVNTLFSVFPTNQICSDPNSIHMFYCSDNRIIRYKNNCLQFGILLEFLKM